MWRNFLQEMDSPNANSVWNTLRLNKVEIEINEFTAI